MTAETIVRDIRHGLTALSRRRAFTLAVLTSLAACISANVAILAITYSVLFKPIPLPDAERVVSVVDAYPGAFSDGSDGRVSTSVPHYQDRLREVESLEHQALFELRGFSVGATDRPTWYPGLIVTPSYFRVAQVVPVLGRVFEDSDATAGNERRVIISDAFWRGRFQRAPDVTTRTLRIDGVVHDIIGVMPQNFQFGREDTALWVPFVFSPQQLSDGARHGGSSTMVARLRAGATLAQAHAEVEAVNARNLERFPMFKSFVTSARFHTMVVPYQDDLVRNIRKTFYILVAGAVFVLLIGVANISNLMLVHARGRAQEFQVRYVLGARRRQIGRQLLVECLLLSFGGAAAGLGLGVLLLNLIKSFGIEQLPLAGQISVDGTVIAGAAASAAVLAVILTAVPFFGVVYDLRPGASSTMIRSRPHAAMSRSVQRTLVVVQVSVAVVLLTSAFLLLSTFERLLSRDFGFNPDRLLTARVELPRRLQTVESRREFAAAAAERIRELPGVLAAGTTNGLPMDDCCSENVLSPEGYVPKPGDPGAAVGVGVVDPGYFQAMGISLRRGRSFEDRDVVGAPMVAIVDEKLASRFWPNQDAIGKRLFFGNTPDPKTIYFTVVAVVATHALTAAEEQGTVGSMFFPINQAPFPRLQRLALVIRTRDSANVANAAASAVASVDPDVALFNVMWMSDRILQRLGPHRLAMALSMTFGIIALVLAGVGVYGVVSYSVAQRESELAVRLALGESTRAVFSRIVGEGLVLCTVSCVIGGGSYLGVQSLMRGLIYGIEPVRPAVVASIFTLLAAVTIIACAMPALRAMRIAPSAVLRSA